MKNTLDGCGTEWYIATDMLLFGFRFGIGNVQFYLGPICIIHWRKK